MNNTSTTTFTVMGQSIDNTTDMNSVQDYSVQNVHATGYTLLMTTKKISGSVSVMGQEKKFDSDDEAIKKSPQMAGPLSVIGKSQEIKVENGKVTASEDMSKVLSRFGMSTDIEEGFATLFFMPDMPGIRQGSSWADSTISATFKVINQYIVTAVTETQVELRVTSDSKMNMTINQAGMTMQTDMKGFSTSTRSYDKRTGLLITEKRAAEMTGTAEGMGVKAPMNIKSTSLITIK